MALAAKRSWLVLAGLIAGAAAVAFAVATGEDGPPDTAAGRKLAEQLCARCHAIGPQGESPSASAPPFRTLHEKYPVENLAESLAEGIVVGHEAMPEFKLTPKQIDDFLAYLETL